MYPDTISNNTVCQEISLTYNQLSKYAEDGCNKVSAFYRDHKVAIDRNIPLFLKVSLYAIAISAIFYAPVCASGAGIAGYALAGRINRVTLICKITWQNVMTDKSYTEEDRTAIKIVILVLGLIAISCLPWHIWAIPVGLSIGSYVRGWPPI